MLTNLSIYRQTPTRCAIFVALLGLQGCGASSDSGATADSWCGPSAGRWKDVAVGYGRTCGIRDNGCVACWGSKPDIDDTAGVVPHESEMAPPRDLLVRLDLSTRGMGESHDPACGITEDGGAVCWAEAGWAIVGETAEGPYQDIAAAYEFTIALDEVGGLHAWGDARRFWPEWADAGLWSSIAVSEDNFCAGNRDGKVRCTSGDLNVALWKLAMSYNGEVCGLDARGAAQCYRFVLGEPTVSYLFEGRDFPETAYADLCLSSDRVCGLTLGGTIECWGDGGYPSVLDGVYKEIDCGHSYECGVTTDGDIRCIDGSGRTDLPGMTPPD